MEMWNCIHTSISSGRSKKNIWRIGKRSHQHQNLWYSYSFRSLNSFRLLIFFYLSINHTTTTVSAFWSCSLHAKISNNPGFVLTSSLIFHFQRTQQTEQHHSASHSYRLTSNVQSGHQRCWLHEWRIFCNEYGTTMLLVNYFRYWNGQ